MLFNASSYVADKTAEEGGYCTEPLDVEPVQSPVYTSDVRNLQKSEWINRNEPVFIVPL
jgi:hypothetical protein